jgi:hypothetical protein
MNWYVYDPIDGFSRYDSEEKAKAAAHRVMDEEAKNAPTDGWSEDIADLEWGEIVPHERACCVKSEPAPDDSEWAGGEIQEWALKAYGHPKR